MEWSAGHKTMETTEPPGPYEDVLVCTVFIRRLLSPTDTFSGIWSIMWNT